MVVSALERSNRVENFQKKFSQAMEARLLALEQKVSAHPQAPLVDPTPVLQKMGSRLVDVEKSVVKTQEKAKEMFSTTGRRIATVEGNFRALAEEFNQEKGQHQAEKKVWRFDFWRLRLGPLPPPHPIGGASPPSPHGRSATKGGSTGFSATGD